MSKATMPTREEILSFLAEQSCAGQDYVDMLRRIADVLEDSVVLPKSVLYTPEEIARRCAAAKGEGNE